MNLNTLRARINAPDTEGGSTRHRSWPAASIVAYAAYDRRLVDYLRALTVVSYGTFLDAGLHVSSASIVDVLNGDGRRVFVLARMTFYRPRVP
jgi:hypothetical protein